MKPSLALLLLPALFSLGCSRKSAVEAATAVSDGYQGGYRDNVIRNWQDQIHDGADCAQP